MIVDETNVRCADATTIRMLGDDHLDVAAWAGLADDVAPGCRPSAATTGWSARSCGPARDGLAGRPRRSPRPGERYPEALDFAGHLVAPLIHDDRVIGALAAVTARRPWTSGDVAFMATLATHAAIALTNAELFAQTEARAAQLDVLQAASARMSRPTHDRGRRPDHRRGDAPGSSTTTTPGST